MRTVAPTAPGSSPSVCPRCAPSDPQRLGALGRRERAGPVRLVAPTWLSRPWRKSARELRVHRREELHPGPEAASENLCELGVRRARAEVCRDLTVERDRFLLGPEVDLRPDPFAVPVVGGVQGERAILERDRLVPAPPHLHDLSTAAEEHEPEPVSYTHLTLPTIYSV